MERWFSYLFIQLYWIQGMFRFQDKWGLTSSTKSVLRAACSGILSLSQVSPGKKTTSLPALLLPSLRARLTCFISLLSLLMPLLSVLVTPVCPTSWMEMAGLDVEEWIGRTGGETHAVLRNYTASALSKEYVRCAYFSPCFSPRLECKLLQRRPHLPSQWCSALGTVHAAQSGFSTRLSEQMKVNIA